jgi:4-amino-4-deoxy-L-arabinose transferase-like glycosyltransferase
VITEQGSAYNLERPGWRRGAATIVLVLGLSFGVGIFDHEIWSPTEPSVAGVVWTMYHGGSLAVPRIHDFAFLEKPPLSYWLPLLSCKAAGELGAGCIRFPSALLGVLSLALLFWIVRLRAGGSVACLAVLFNLTSMEFYDLAHRAGNDIAALAFVYLCFALFLRSLMLPASGTAKIDAAFAAGLAVSFYAKNFFTYLFVLPPVLLFLALRRQYRRAAKLVLWLAVFSVLAISPWLAAIYHEGGWDYVRVVVFDNTFGRFFNIADPERFQPEPLNDAFRAERDRSPYFFLYMFFWPSAPWTLVFLAALLWLFRRPASDDAGLFLKVGLLTVPLLLSLSASGAGSYISPLLFLMLVLIGDFAAKLYARPETLWRLERGLAVGNMLLVPVLLIAAPVGLGWYFGIPLLFGLAACAAVVFFAAARRLKGEWHGLRFAWRTACGAAVSAFLALWAVMPSLEGRKSHAVFFREIGEHIEGRELYTNTLNITRLPLIVYYLDRRVEIVQDTAQILELLGGENKISVILDRQGYRDVRPHLEQLPHQVVAASSGSRHLILVNNP